MAKIFILLISILIPAVAAAETKQDWPKGDFDQRLERRSTAHNKALMKAAYGKDKAKALCYYDWSAGCDKATMAEDNRQQAEGYEEPRQYPRQGYTLGNDGLYHFKSGAMSRN